MVLENRISTRVRWRACAQSYSPCTLLEKYDSPATVRTRAKLYKIHIFISFPLGSVVSRSTYTVVPESLSPRATHSAYTGPLQSNSNVSINHKPKMEAS